MAVAAYLGTGGATAFPRIKPLHTEETPVLSTQKLTALRRQFATAIEKEIQSLLLLREQERHQDSWLRRLLSA